MIAKGHTEPLSLNGRPVALSTQYELLEYLAASGFLFCGVDFKSFLALIEEYNRRGGSEHITPQSVRDTFRGEG